jgi:hypothetical protein
VMCKQCHIQPDTAPKPFAVRHSILCHDSAVPNRLSNRVG